MDGTAAIEMIRRIVADDTADLRERIQHLEQRTNGLNAIKDNSEYISMAEPGDTDTIKALQDRLDKIKAIHRLDATPVQWTRDNAGKMVEAPEGLWELQCVVCRDTPPVIWRQGEPRPQQCLTWRLADGQ